jgi:hypothetical protein
MSKRIISDLFFTDEREPVEVEIEEFTDGNKFMLVPVRQRDRDRWQKEHKMCPTCGGLGFFPGEKRLLTCPRCKGQAGPSHASPDVRAAILNDIVKGWSGWLSASGRDIPYSEQTVAKVAEDFDLYNIIITAASETVKKSEDEEGN